MMEKKEVSDQYMVSTMETAAPGQIWIAADGGHYGHLVVGLNKNKQDAIVRAFVSDGFAEADCQPGRIDLYKITYRYMLPEGVPAWIPDVVIREAHRLLWSEEEKRIKRCSTKKGFHGLMSKLLGGGATVCFRQNAIGSIEATISNNNGNAHCNSGLTLWQALTNAINKT